MWLQKSDVYLAALLIWALAPAQALAGVWQDIPSTGARAAGDPQAADAYYRALSADEPQLRQALATAPLERTASQGGLLELPLPNGETQSFEVLISPIMSPALAARRADFQTYSVKGLDDPSISGRLDMSPYGFHAMLETTAGTVFIDPDGLGNYRSYYKQDYPVADQRDASERVCQLGDHAERVIPGAGLTPSMALRTLTAGSRHVYRLAMVTTGEYGSYFGSQSAAESAVITTINRVNQIYGRDLAVQLQLVEIIVYSSAGSDPFDQTDVSGMLGINQDVLDYAVGLDNYDVGHLFGTSGGGLAFLSSACTTSRAQGYTGHPSPDVGDPFDIDFVAHEIGHQLGATHTFNGTTQFCGGGNRTASTAVEPGSGSTIMAYAGICGAENLQSNSDATFHATSIGQINNFVFGGGAGGSCGTRVGVANSLPATISAGSDVTIPAQTPFMLTATTSADPDGDTVSYQWDQIDVGTETTDATIGSDLGDNALFRTFVPKSTPTRYFPRLSSLIAGSTDIGETLPTTPRHMDFRVTVRDGRSGVGDDDVRVNVMNSQGPFRVSGGDLNVAGTYSGGFQHQIDWDPAGTAGNCVTVNISLLSLSNDDKTYCSKEDYPATATPTLDLGDFANANGTALVLLPTALIEKARVVISCTNPLYPFFALSEVDIAVASGGSTVIANNCRTTDGDSLEHGGVTTNPNITLGGFSSGGGGGGALQLWTLLLLAGALIRQLAVRRHTD